MHARAAASGLFMVVLWVLRLQPAPQLSARFLLALAPVALFHTIGHVSACVSFSQMAVSFAHIVKAAEPVSVQMEWHAALHLRPLMPLRAQATSHSHHAPCPAQVFSVALSGPLLGAGYPVYVWASLVPIVAGCAMSAMKEVCDIIV
jgi:solute carrier family 35 protein E1